MPTEPSTTQSVEIQRISNGQTLKVMANPLRMRILGVLRINGAQTVGTISDYLGEAPGAISYHLAQLAQVGLVEKMRDPNNDKRKSWWKASQPAVLVESASDDNANDEATDLFRRSAALSYEQTYERYLDALPQLPQEWVDAGASNDFILQLTAEELSQMLSELTGVVKKWTMQHSVPSPQAEQVALIMQGFRWIP